MATIQQKQKAIQEKGSRWTLSKCRRTAKRFETEAQWAGSAQSAYKAAVAHGWLSQCLEAQKNTN